MEQILDFKSETLGNFKLSDYNQRNKSGSVYVNFDYDWTQIVDGYFRFNRLDTKNTDVLKPIIEIFSQNLYKTDYLILVLNNNKGSSISFFVNRNTVIFDEENDIYKLLVTKPDFIGSKGMPLRQSEYSLSYIINDPSKEKNITHTDVTSSLGSLAKFTPDIKPKAIKPPELPPMKYYQDPKIPVNVSDYIQQGPKVYENDAYRRWNTDKQKQLKEKDDTICGVKTSYVVTSAFVVTFLYLLKKYK